MLSIRTTTFIVLFKELARAYAAAALIDIHENGGVHIISMSVWRCVRVCRSGNKMGDLKSN